MAKKKPRLLRPPLLLLPRLLPLRPLLLLLLLLPRPLRLPRLLLRLRLPSNRICELGTASAVEKKPAFGPVFLCLDFQPVESVLLVGDDETFGHVGQYLTDRGDHMVGRIIGLGQVRRDDFL